MRHFQMSVYSQLENMNGSFMNPPPQLHGAWHGVRNIMRTLAEEITKEGMSLLAPGYAVELSINARRWR